MVIEAVLAGEKGAWDCPILLKVFGPDEAVARGELETKLKSDKIVLKKQRATAPKKPLASTPAAPGRYVGSQSTQPSSQSEPDIQQFVEASERFRPRDVEKLVDEWGVGEEAMARMPMADQPEELQSTLLPYQRQGLAWMIQKENTKLPEVGSNDVVQLWKRQQDRPNVFQNLATGFATSTAPSLAKGGILADDMGVSASCLYLYTYLGCRLEICLHFLTSARQDPPGNLNDCFRNSRNYINSVSDERNVKLVATD